MRVVPNYVLIYNLIPFPEQALLQFDCAFPKFLMERVCLLYDTFRFFLPINTQPSCTSPSLSSSAPFVR